jgi:phosphate-selective porin OprO/OprP
MDRCCSFAIAFAVLSAAAGRVQASEAANPSLAKEVDAYLTEVAPGADKSTLSVSWKDRPRVETSDGAFVFELIGRFMWDSFWESSDDLPPTATQDGTFFRRARLGVQGHVYQNLEFRIEMDFATGTVVLTDVYMGLRKLGAVGTIRVGHMKEPFGLEALESANDITFLERSAATDAFAPFRNDGIQLMNAILGDRATWAAGIFRESNNQGVATGDGGYTFTARLTGLPMQNKDRQTLIHVGVCFSLRDPPTGTAQFQARPGIAAGPRLVDPGSLATEDVMLLCFEFAWAWRALSVQAEAFLTEVHGDGVADSSFSGWYVQVSYWITGESRPYKAKEGVFGAPKPKRALHDAQGGFGAWEIALRFDAIDLTDGAVVGGEQTSITFGANWHWNKNARVMFHIVFTDVEDGNAGANNGELTIFETRFQFNF